LTTPNQVTDAYKWASSFSKATLIEQHCTGIDYRILVCDGKVIAVTERTPPAVVGNGFDSIQMLIEQLNNDPRRGTDKKSPMTKVIIDNDLIWNLSQANLTLKDVLLPSRKVQLRSIANLSVGSSTTDRTDEIHPDNKQLAIFATSLVGLDICGVDLISKNISKSYKEEPLSILEMNANPGIRSHISPSNGQSRDVAGYILDYLFPGSVKLK
jgi:cyanophycin synthetase